jgi:hypothetical protein
MMQGDKYKATGMEPNTKNENRIISKGELHLLNGIIFDEECNINIIC